MVECIVIFILVTIYINKVKKKKKNKYTPVNSHYREETLHPKENSVSQAKPKPRVVNEEPEDDLFKEWEDNRISAKEKRKALIRDFEDRDSDWLACQLAYEKKAKIGSMSHHDDCDAEKLRQEHRRQHNLF